MLMPRRNDQNDNVGVQEDLPPIGNLDTTKWLLGDFQPALSYLAAHQVTAESWIGAAEAQIRRTEATIHRIQRRQETIQS